MVELALNDIACTGCIGKIKRGMKKYNGVEKIEILSGSGKLKINFNEKIIQLSAHLTKTNCSPRFIYFRIWFLLHVRSVSAACQLRPKILLK
jgi:copper chaperone CopZ